MPGFDGTGPRGEGPLTGRGEGYCAIQLPNPGSDRPAFGFAGLLGRPVCLYPRADSPVPAALPLPRLYARRRLGRGRSFGAGRGRGRWFFTRV